MSRLTSIGYQYTVKILQTVVFAEYIDIGSSQVLSSHNSLWRWKRLWDFFECYFTIIIPVIWPNHSKVVWYPPGPLFASWTGCFESQGAFPLIWGKTFSRQNLRHTIGTDLLTNWYCYDLKELTETLYFELNSSGSWCTSWIYAYILIIFLPSFSTCFSTNLIKASFMRSIRLRSRALAACKEFL